MLHSARFDKMDRWLRRECDFGGPECPVMLVGNKSDLDSERQVDRQEG